MSRSRFFLAIAACFFSLLPVPAQSLALKADRLFDGTGSAPIEQAVLLIEGNRIVAVGTAGSVTIPPDATVIDLPGVSILPGLVELHSHPNFFSANPRRFEDDALIALRGSAILKQALEAGITLFRDAGAPHYTALGLRHAIDQKLVPGPRFVVSNNIIGSTGAHASEFELMYPSKFVLESDSPGEWRRHIRQNIKMGADFIKVTPPFTREEIQVAVQESHDLGVRIAVHAGGFIDPHKMLVEYAVEAGADTIEHLYAMKNIQRVMQLMRDQGTIVVPTLSASRRFAGERWQNPSESDIENEETPADYEARFRALHQYGVKMAIGTDTGGGDQGKIAAHYIQELQMFLDWGYTPLEVIQAATQLGAQAVGRDKDLGTLTAGRLADVIVCRGNPQQSIETLTHPILVLLNGQIVVDRRDEN